MNISIKIVLPLHKGLNFTQFKIEKKNIQRKRKQKLRERN